MNKKSTDPHSRYNSARVFMGTRPNWVVDEDDADRIRAYGVYENFYWNEPGTYQLLERGDDEQPIYLPCARKIVEATNRFLAVDWDFLVDVRFGNAEEQAELQRRMLSLFRREMMYAKFATQKRYGLIRGDALWHITADPTKVEGSRISIHELDPASYFPIVEEDNLDRIVGCHLVDLITDPRDENKVVARRQTYRKGAADGLVTSRVAAYELDAWDDRYLEPNEIKKISWDGEHAEFALNGITSLPVYHIKNNRVPQFGFGLSEIKGIETVLKAINQTVSDMDLSLALAGLGVYATTAAARPAADGEEATELEIGPARMVEVGQGENVWRVSGVGSVAPVVDYISLLNSEIQQGIGIPDIAAGKVDVSVAESGISLALQLAPILAKNSEKELEMLGVYDHMLYDLCTQWMPGYDGFTVGPRVVATTVVGDPLPTNRNAVLAELLQLRTAGLITVDMAIAKLTALGYEFDEAALTALTAPVPAPQITQDAAPPTSTGGA